MNYFRTFTRAAAYATVALVAWNGLPATAALVTTNLFVQLDGTNLANNGDPISAWVDQKTDEDVTPLNNHQDFGQLAITPNDKRPVVRVMTMPNSSTHKVAEFNRGTVTSTNNSNATSDFLQGSTGGLGTAYGGADPAFDFTTGMSFFVVYRSRVVSTSTSGNNERQQRQGVLAGAYGAKVDKFGTFFTEDTGDTSTPAEAVPDLYNNVETSAHSYGDVTALEASWYLSAVSWDFTSSTARSVILSEDGPLSPATILSAVWGTPAAHSSTNLGAFTTAVTNGQHLDGWIAELLIYNAALSEVDFNAVVDHLNLKYFTAVPEASPLWFGGLACGLIGLVHVGRRLRKSWTAK